MHGTLVQIEDELGNPLPTGRWAVLKSVTFRDEPLPLSGAMKVLKRSVH